MSDQEPVSDDVPFDQRCDSCGVPYSQESMDGGRCLACHRMILPLKKSVLVDWYSFIAGFLVGRPQEEWRQYQDVRQSVKNSLFVFIYSNHTLTAVGFANVMVPLLTNPTPDRRRALSSLGRYWGDELKKSLTPKSRTTFNQG